MPTHKSCYKRMRTATKQNERNRVMRSRMKTVVKKVLESKDRKSAEEAMKTAVSIIDKTLKAGVIHKNTAANRKSQIMTFVNKIAA